MEPAAKSVHAWYGNQQKQYDKISDIIIRNIRFVFFAILLRLQPARSLSFVASSKEFALLRVFLLQLLSKGETWKFDISFSRISNFTETIQTDATIWVNNHFGYTPVEQHDQYKWNQKHQKKKLKSKLNIDLQTKLPCSTVTKANLKFS